MGYHVELVATPPRPIQWDELAQAGQALGWQVHDKEQELRLERDGVLVARMVLTDGEAWVKTPDDDALAAMIALADRMGVRARGDEWESYRSVDDWYVHPDDQAERDTANAARRAMPSQAARLWRGRIAVVAVFMVIGLAYQLVGG